MTLPAPISIARRHLDQLDGITITGEFAWIPTEDAWSLTLNIQIEESDNKDVPLTTSWFLFVSPAYPLGIIKLRPATQGGIAVTFPHQDHNGAAKGVPFRRGGLCLEAPTGTESSEPFDAIRRLAWHVRRAREWIQGAAQGTLRAAGDRFELPYWPNTRDDLTISFDEAVLANTRPSNLGWLELASVNPRHLVCIGTTDGRSRSLSASSFGSYVTKGARQTGVWLRCPRIPIVTPWGAPETWAELRVALRGMGLDLETLFSFAARRKAHTMLLGFPIPAVVGGPDTEMWWQALTLPDLRRASKTPRAKRRRIKALGSFAASDADKIQWIPTENVSRTRLGARSNFGERISNVSIAIVGAGALGSMLVDMLVRGGCERLHILDPQSLAMGNLVRHSLDMRSLGGSKASALATRANASMPYVTASSASALLSTSAVAARDELEQYDVIVDCTGSDFTLRALAQIVFRAPKLIVSASVGRHARRLFFFSTKSTNFPFDDFKRLIAPWLESETSTSDRVWEGAGCWHPVSQARVDWLSIAAATSARLLSEALSVAPELQVFEHEESSAPDVPRYLGFRRKTEP